MYSPPILNDGEITSGQRGEGSETLGFEKRLFGELWFSDSEPVEVGAGDGQALGAKVPGDGERAMNPRITLNERLTKAVTGS